VVVNNSFSARGEPIVGAPDDAFQLHSAEFETLVSGHPVLVKVGQNPNLKLDSKNALNSIETAAAEFYGPA
jgi:carbamoyltransferase